MWKVEVMSQEQINLKDNQFIFQDKIVVTVSHFAEMEDKENQTDEHRWTYQDLIAYDHEIPVEHTLVKKVNEKLYFEIVKAIDDFKVQHERIKKAREEERERQRVLEATEKINTYKKKLQEEAPAEFWDLKPVFENPERMWGQSHPYAVKFEGLSSVELDYQTEIYGSGYYPTKTDKVWVLEVSYKKRRYKNLQTVIKKIQEIIKAQEEKANSEQAQKEKFANWEEQVGMDLVKKYHSYHGRRGGYYTYHFVPKGESIYTATIVIRVSEYKDQPEASRVELKGPIKFLGQIVREVEFDVILHGVEEIKNFVKKINENLVK